MKTEAAKTARMVKEALKECFPGIVFSVKSKNYSGGNSVTAYWTDGPTSGLVDVAINRFQAGDFDGMTDCYNFRKERPDHPTARYVFATRTVSKSLAEYTLNYLKNVMRWDEFIDSPLSIVERWSDWSKSFVWEFDPATDGPTKSGNGYKSQEVMRFASRIAVNAKGEYVRDPNFFYWEREVL